MARFGLFGGAGLMAGQMGRNMGKDLTADRRSGVVGADQGPQPRRGLFGRARNFLARENEGVSNMDRVRLAAAYMRDDPSFANAAERGLAFQRQQYQQDQERQAEQEQVKAGQLQSLQEQRDEAARLAALEAQFGYEPGSLANLPEDARNSVIQEAAQRRFVPEEREPGQTRTRVDGNSSVFEQFNGQTGQWEQVSSGPRWNPNSSPVVEVNTGDGPQPDPFQETLMGAEAEQFVSFMERAPAAYRNLQQIDRLEGLLANTNTGIGAAARLRAREFGISLGDDVSDLEAANALISAMVPQQRPPGSGQMSDADLALFRESLPRLINTPEGNRVIIDTMRAVNQYDAALGQIAQAAASGEIDRTEARRQVNQLNNPIDQLRQELGEGEPDQSGPIYIDY
jgi:hypothetical protein